MSSSCASSFWEDGYQRRCIPIPTCLNGRVSCALIAMIACCAVPQVKTNSPFAQPFTACGPACQCHAIPAQPDATSYASQVAADRDDNDGRRGGRGRRARLGAAAAAAPVPARLGTLAVAPPGHARSALRITLPVRYEALIVNARTGRRIRDRLSTRLPTRNAKGAWLCARRLRHHAAAAHAEAGQMGAQCRRRPGVAAHHGCGRRGGLCWALTTACFPRPCC